MGTWGKSRLLKTSSPPTRLHGDEVDARRRGCSCGARPELRVGPRRSHLRWRSARRALSACHTHDGRCTMRSIKACFAARHWRSARLQKRALRLISRQWLSRSPLWKLSVAPVLTSEALGLSIAHRCDTKGTPSGRCECGWYDVALLGTALALLRSALNHMYAFAVEWREE